MEDSIYKFIDDSSLILQTIGGLISLIAAIFGLFNKEAIRDGKPTFSGWITIGFIVFGALVSAATKFVEIEQDDVKLESEKVQRRTDDSTTAIQLQQLDSLSNNLNSQLRNTKALQDSIQTASAENRLFFNGQVKNLNNITKQLTENQKDQIALTAGLRYATSELFIQNFKLYPCELVIAIEVPLDRLSVNEKLLMMSKLETNAEKKNKRLFYSYLAQDDSVMVKIRDWHGLQKFMLWFSDIDAKELDHSRFTLGGPEYYLPDKKEIAFQMETNWPFEFVGVGNRPSTRLEDNSKGRTSDSMSIFELDKYPFDSKVVMALVGDAVIYTFYYRNMRFVGKVLPRSPIEMLGKKMFINFIGKRTRNMKVISLQFRFSHQRENEWRNFADFYNPFKGIVLTKDILGLEGYLDGR